MNIKNTFFGFTDNLNTLQKGKAEKVLDNAVRVDGVLMTEKEFIYKKLQEGYRPTIEYNYSYYSSKTDSMTKPKDDYRLVSPDESFYSVNKTLYNYSVYLLENDLINEHIAANFIMEEQNKIKQEEAEKQRIQAEEKAKKEEEKRQQEEFKNWLNENQTQYSNVQKLNLVREIFLNEKGYFDDLYGKRILTLIENIDNPHCRKMLKDILHSGNTTSKKVFSHITGIKLPSTDKGTMPILDSISSGDYVGMVEYKKRATREDKPENDIKLDTFYKFNGVTGQFEEVFGEPITKYGLDMFIVKTEKAYIICECKCGLPISNAKTKTDLFEDLRKKIDQHGIDKINSLVESAINRNGLSPKYKNNTLSA
jgi:hypothetical protein